MLIVMQRQPRIWRQTSSSTVSGDELTAPYSRLDDNTTLGRPGTVMETSITRSEV